METYIDSYTSAYSCTLATAKETLEKYGVCVIPEVVNRDKCSECLGEIWDYLEDVSVEWNTPLDREDKSTWSMDNFNPKHNMLVQHHSIGHCQAAWDIRQNEDIVNVFASLFDADEEDMLVSFDGISICFPPEVTGKGFAKSNGSWAHSDTSYTKKINDDNILYQGWFTPVSVRTGDATLACMVGSHKYHQTIARKFDLKDKADWHKLTQEEEDAYASKGCHWQRIICPAGSLVLWDCRTIHYGQQPLKDRATAAMLRKKQKAFEEMRLTSHDPIRSMLFPAKPSSRWGSLDTEPVLKITLPVLTELGKRLAGY